MRLVTGVRNVTRHGKEEQLRKKAEESLEQFGPLKKPSFLKGEAAKAWKRYIEPATWLDASREATAIRFCQLWQESQLAPFTFLAAKDGQLRAYMAELGLTDERNRIYKPDEKTDEYFDD